jgi:hypothetical protein
MASLVFWLTSSNFTTCFLSAVSGLFSFFISGGRKKTERRKERTEPEGGW